MKAWFGFVDVAVAAEPTWAVAAVASSSVSQDERHSDRNQIVRQVRKLYIDQYVVFLLVSIGFRTVSCIPIGLVPSSLVKPSLLRRKFIN